MNHAQGHGTTRQCGFTLVELSIVLVIIALIAGGIVVGYDLVRLATLRSQITQYETFDIAVNTFKAKYQAYPGDIQATHAAELGFVARSGNDGSGDGDGTVEGCSPPANYQLGCEAGMFWRDLSEAKLIPHSFYTATDTDPIIRNIEEARLYFPTAKVGMNKLIVVGADTQKRMWYVMLKGLYIDPPSAGFSWAFNPTDAYAMDSKMDDGKPLSGSFMIGWPQGAPANFFGTPQQGNGYCVNNDEYNLAYENEYCLPLVKMQSGL